MTLKDDLLAQKARSRERIGEERTRAFEQGIAELAADLAARTGLAIGDRAPDFTLPNALGQPVSLADRLAGGPVVLAFYRGAWCPYCNIELRALQMALPDLAGHGATLIAISPQGPDESLSLIEKEGLAFDVLTDAGCAVAEAYGIAFTLPEALQSIYIDMGNDLPAKNAGDDWRLPVPATFVIGRDGRVVYAHVEADYRERAEPSEVIAAVAGAAAATAA